MTFDKAYCLELDANVTAYKARREYFSQEDNKSKYTFYCPDENCNVQLSGVNIFTVGLMKRKPHFKTKNGLKHSKDCSIIIEKTVSLETGSKKPSKRTSSISNSFPNEFILSRPKKEVDSKGSKETYYDDDFDIEPRAKRKSREGYSSGNKPHQTSYLENVVDSFEDMDKDERIENKITLNGQTRPYKYTFKNIMFFADGTNFIFYGEIKPIKKYGKNYAITFKNWAELNGKSYSIGIYITEELIKNYRLSRLFEDTISNLANLEGKFKSARCYFVGAYPKMKTITTKTGSSYDVLEVFITNLDHLVIKFTE